MLQWQRDMIQSSEADFSGTQLFLSCNSRHVLVTSSLEVRIQGRTPRRITLNGTPVLLWAQISEEDPEGPKQLQTVARAAKPRGLQSFLQEVKEAYVLGF